MRGTFLFWAALCASMAGLCWVGSGCGGGPTATERMVGGQCRYRDYPGTATIISTMKAEEAKVVGGPSYQAHEVRFTCVPDGKVTEAFAQDHGREQILRLANSWAPGPKFLTKYGIEPGKHFPCIMRVIQTGTCTPIIFDFPTIDLSDYFESQ